MSEQAQRFQRLQCLFATALEYEGEARSRFLGGLNGLDAELRTELERLLQRDADERCHATLRPHAVIGAVLDEALGPLPERIGRFEIIGELGRGGMGRVLHGVVRDAGFEQHAAIKILRRDVWDPSGESRLQEEARALAGLDHPGIARLLEAGRSAEGLSFVAMERVEGEPLLAWCARHELGVLARLRLFEEILSAVAHAHRALVVHRDIKPANVMVDREGRCRLLDFGLARMLDRDSDQRTQTAARFLTPAYAAPEQVRGERITIACDLYALGALLYELLSGVPPFALAGKTAGEAERLILDVPPEPLAHSYRHRPGAAEAVGQPDRTGWARQLRGDLEHIVQKALRKQPQARYSSVETFAEDLARWRGLRPVRARRGHLWYRTQRFLQRHRLAVATSALAVAGAVFAVAQVLSHAQAAAHQRDRAVAALELLNQAFLAADPARVSAGETSVRAVLAAAAGRVQALATRNPGLHAELAAQISEIRTGLGLRDADDLLAPALDWAESLPAADPLRLRVLLAAAHAAVLTQQPAQAQAWLTRIDAEWPGDNEAELLRAHLALQDDTPAEALPRLQALLARLPAEGDSRLQREARWHLAEALRLSGDPQAALIQLDALAAEQSRDAQTAAALLTQLRRGDVLVELGQADTAAQELRQLLPALEGVYGNRSAVLGMAWGSLAGALSAQQNYAGSAEAFASAADAYARSVGDQHLNVARARFNSAQLKLYLDPADSSADVQFEAAIEAASRARHPLDPLPLFFRASYARGLLARGDRDGARAHLLPAEGEPDLSLLAAPNRADLRDLLQQLYGPFDCADAAAGAGRADDVATLRARRLCCRSEPLSVVPRLQFGARPTASPHIVFHPRRSSAA